MEAGVSLKTEVHTRKSIMVLPTFSLNNLPIETTEQIILLRLFGVEPKILYLIIFFTLYFFAMFASFQNLTSPKTLHSSVKLTSALRRFGKHAKKQAMRTMKT